MLRRAIGDMIAEEISKFQSSDLRLGKELLSYVEISYDGLVAKIAQIEKSVQIFTYGSDEFGRAEQLLVQQFVHSGRSHPSKAIAAAMSAMHQKVTFILETLRQWNIFCPPAFLTFSQQKAHFSQTPSLCPPHDIPSFGSVMTRAAALRVCPPSVLGQVRVLVRAVVTQMGEKRGGSWERASFVGGK